MKNLNSVIQEEISGCGIASVAVLAKISYQEAKDLVESLGIQTIDKSLWRDTGYVRTLLRSLNIVADEKEHDFSSWEKLPNIALLAIKLRIKNGKSSWHWVVFWRSPSGPVVLDSKKTLRNHRRTDFGRMKPRFFIPVSMSSWQ